MVGFKARETTLIVLEITRNRKIDFLNIYLTLTIESKSHGAEEFLAQVTYGFRNTEDNFQNQKVYLIMLSLKNILQA